MAVASTWEITNKNPGLVNKNIGALSFFAARIGGTVAYFAEQTLWLTVMKIIASNSNLTRQFLGGMILPSH